MPETPPPSKRAIGKAGRSQVDPADIGGEGRLRTVPAKRKAGRSYRQLIGRIVNYVWQTDDQGVIRSVSAGKGLNVLGYPMTAFVGMTLPEFAGGELRLPLEAVQSELLSAKSDFISVEVLLQARNGREIWFELSGVSQFDRSGRFLGYWGVGRDIDARKKAEEALIYRDQLLNAVTQAAAEIVGTPAVDAAIPRALEMIGKALDVDRVVVLEADNPAEPGTALTVTHAWQTPLALAALDARGSRNAPGASALIPWDRTLSKGSLVSASMDTAAGDDSAVLGMLGAKSALLVPIRAQGQWWGGIGIDDCRRNRDWSESEINALSTFAEMVGGSIIRREQQVGRRRAELELRRRSRRDNLTGLMNRQVFSQAMRRALDRANRGDGRFALHYLDLDHFKDVNDTLGHPVGDQLLKEVAIRLRGQIRHSDVLARFGGDEFAVLEMDTENEAQASVLAQKLIDAMKRPFFIDGREIRVSASVGVAVYKGAADDPDTLLSHAELALYRAKAEGRQTFCHYVESMDTETRSRVGLTEELRKAIEGNQFFMVYQPQVDLETGRIVGVEALIRWRHPEHGLIPPSEFIPAAERNGMILPIGRWVLQEVCRQARLWLDKGLAPPVIGVNVSAAQFRRPDDLEREVLADLAAARLPRGLIQLELTETTLMETTTLQSDVLARLHDDGVKISLDDFGTGYSSLDYLRRYPVDQIKIAEVFVAGITRNAGDATIVRAAIGLARELGLRVLAEGARDCGTGPFAEAMGLQRGPGLVFRQGHDRRRPRSPVAARPDRPGPDRIARTSGLEGRHPGGGQAGRMTAS